MKNNKKCILALLLTLALALSLTACGTQNTSFEGDIPERNSFTDSTGRVVDIPSTITKVAVSGPITQIIMYTLAPDMMVALSGNWGSDASQYIPAQYLDLPLLGQLYGGKEEMDLEAVLAIAPDIILDIGEPKGSIAEDMDTMQTLTGIPCLHIDAFFSTMADTYTMLGDLLNRQEDAAKLASFYQDTYDRILGILDDVGDLTGAVYCLGDTGTNVICKTSYHAEVLDMLTNNLAVSESPSSKGTGNEVSLEEIYNWNPDVIFFAPDSYYDAVAIDPAWQSLGAIESGNYYEVPFALYNWMGFPPSVQRCLGIMWMTSVLYPDYCDYDLQEKVTEFYELFFHCSLTQEQYNAIMTHSLPHSN